jgi:ribonuclease P protein component
MISRAHRFHGYNSLRHVYQNGAAARGPSFAVKSLLNQRRSTYRLSVVVSRKVEKSAVARNRIRRRNVQAIEGDITGPYDIVLTVFSNSLLSEPADALARQLKSQFASAGILDKRRPQ